MKRIVGLLLGIVLLAGTALPTLAQTSRRQCRTQSQYGGRTSQRYENARRVNNDRYNNNNGYNRSNSSYNRYGRSNNSFWDRHRDKLTLGAGTGAGAVIGAIAGGGKGAAIGALLGAGGSALYTYKIRNRSRNRY